MKKLMCLFSQLVLLTFLLPVMVVAGDKPLNIAVASNFIPTMKKIVADYQMKTQQVVNVLSGSTGKHYSQITYGAPIDLFFAADQTRPKKLVEQGRASNQFTYAIGSLVYWYPAYQGKPIDFETAIHLSTKRISLANPSHAPYGKASQEVLARISLWQNKQNQLHYAFTENVAQSYMLIKSKSVTAGFIAYAQAKQDKRISHNQYWLVPQSYYQPIKQDAVIIRPSKKVSAFLDYFKSDEVKRVIQADGYAL